MSLTHGSLTISRSRLFWLRVRSCSLWLCLAHTLQISHSIARPLISALYLSLSLSLERTHASRLASVQSCAWRTTEGETCEFVRIDQGYCESKKILVTGHDNGCVRLWNLDTGSTINMTHHSNTVSCIISATLKRGEEFMLTGSFDGKVGIWDVRKKSSVRPHLVSMFEAHPHSEVLCLLFDQYKRTIITAGNDAVRLQRCKSCES